MKASNSFPRFMQNNAALLIAMFALSSALTSCQKDEITQPSKARNNIPVEKSAADAQQISVSAEFASPAARVGRSYEMLVIDHISGMGIGANYKVTIMSSGLVKFEGRRNVGSIGQYEFKVDAASLEYIKGLFLAADFFSIKDHFVYIPDAAEVHTTFSNGEIVKSLADHNDGDPHLLIQIRIAAEEKLGISRYLGKKAIELAAPTTLEL
jgi:hypothetical protein